MSCVVLLFVSTFSELSTVDFLVVFAVGGNVIRFTAISTLAYCVSISAFNDARLGVTRTRVVVVVVVIVVGRVSAGRSRGSRTSVLLLSLVTH